MRRKITDGRTRLIPQLVSAIIFISILAAAASGTAFLFQNWASMAGEAADRAGVDTCAPAPTGMVAWWPGDGNANDIQGPTFENGTLMNGASYADGKVGQSFSFNGSSQYLEIPDGPSLRPVDGLTLAGWFAFTDAASQGALVSKPFLTSSYNSFVVWRQGDNLWAGIFSAVLGYPIAPEAGHWYHIAYTYDEATHQHRLFIDGVVVAQTIFDSDLTYDSAGLLIGIDKDSSTPTLAFDGKADEVIILGRELSVSEIQAIYNAGSLGICRPATTLGDYSDASVALSGNAVVTPEASPSGITRITAIAPTNFRGQLSVDNSTGAVRVTNAHPAGVHPITVKAFGPGGTETKTFQLTVSSGQACNTIGFQPAASFPLGASPTAAALGDFNNDGHQDVAMTASPNLLLVWSGSGTGTFPGSAAFTVGNSPMAVAAGDLNGDGNTDIVTANLNSHTISVLMNNGAGSFASAVHYSVGNAPRSVAIADLNNDGLLDIAAANVDSNSVSILLGDGTGTFPAAANFPTGTNPISIAVGDLNGDGNKDIASANFAGNSVSVVLGNGLGGFGSPATYGGLSNPHFIIVADLNNDGNQDVATPNVAADQVSVMLGNGTGILGPPTHYSVGSTPVTVTTGDLDRDGSPDLVTADHLSGQVSILRGDGLGGFSAAVPVAVGTVPYGLAVGDLNGDGVQDIVSANGSSNDLSLLLGVCAVPTPTPTPCFGLSNVQNDFSETSNPNGHWSYGYKQTLNDPFILYDTLNNAGSFPSWFSNAHHSPDHTPAVGKNLTGGTIDGVGPGEVALHPGWDGSFSTVRWTAPFAATFKFDGCFGAGDTGAMSYYVYVNGTQQHQWINAPSTECFIFSSALQAGDVVDFIVGVNTGSGYGWGNTPLSLNVCSATAPSPTPNRGSIQFSSASYNGDEGTDAVITFTRAGGSDGAVSAVWTYTGGTAIRGGTCGLGGTDFISAASGTVNWTDQDSADKTLTIHLCEDASDSEVPETADFELSSPTGGATLGTPVSTTLTINDVPVPTPTPTPTPTCIAAPNGIVSWWRADDNALDVMNLNNGVLQNGTAFSPGVVGKAFELDGIDDFVQANPTSGLPVGAAPRTIEMWFRTPLDLTVNTESAMFQYGTANSSQMFGLITSGNAPGRLYFYGHANDLAGTTVLQPDTWYHAAVTYDGATVRLYLNGSLDASGPKTLNTILDGSGITIGSRPGGSKWKGQIDEPTLYNRELSASEIAAIYQAGSSGKCGTCSPAPVGMKALWKGEANALDSRGPNNGTLYGGTAFASGVVGQSFMLDGINDFVEIPDHDSLKMSEAFTLEAWVYPTNTDNWHQVISKFSITPYLEYQLGIDPGGILRVDISQDGTDYEQLFSPNASINANAWQHIAATFDSGATKLYVNGVEVSSAVLPISSVNTNSTFPLMIGQDGRYIDRFAGSIDEVAIFDRALTPSELRSQYLAGSIGKCTPTATTPPSGIVRWWGGDGDLKNFSPIFAPLNDVNGVGFFLGKVGQGFRFRRANQTYFWATDNGMPFGDASRTVEFWAKPAYNARMPFFYGGFSTAGAFYPMFIYDRACIGNWNGGDVCGTTNVTDGRWHHIALTYSQSDHIARLYVNGGLEATMSRVYNSVPTGSVFIGSSTPAGSNEYYDGDLDEITVYDHQLLGPDIIRIYKAGMAGKLKQVPASVSGGGFAARSEGSGYIYVGDAAVSFPTVTTAGQLHEIPIALNGLPPLPYLSMGLTYDIATSAEYTGQPTVCFNLPAFTPPEYNGMRILHLENGQWVDRTVLSNTYPVRCATGMTSLSPFAIAYLTPTAAGVSVSGRVLDGTGRGIINARLTLTDTAGTVRTTVSNSFGYYRFEAVPVGETYVIEATHRRFRFIPQAVNVSDHVNQLDLIGIE